MMANDERIKSLLSNLGRATLRGVRKCPKCGTLNGSRGHCCKNKLCDVVFRDPGDKRSLSTEASKLITGTTAQIFSVRARNKDPDYRGFVQLPLVCSSTSTLNALLCFIEGCERSFETNVLTSDEKKIVGKPLTNCQHIQAALRCYAEAQPLTLRNSVLSSLNVNNEMKQEIWLLATETSGPLVQRVSKHMMVVKCKASPKHPLGYLHFTFYMVKLKDKIDYRFLCSCATFKVPKSVDKVDLTHINQNTRCIHFYSCICAFASDEKLSEEFEYYINLDHSDLSVTRPLGSNLRSSEDETLISMDVERLNEDTHLIFRDDDLTVNSVENDFDTVDLDTTIEKLSEDGNPNFLDDAATNSQPYCIEVGNQNSLLSGSKVTVISNEMVLNKFNVKSSQCILDDNYKIIATNDGEMLPLGNSVRLLDENLISDNNLRIIDKNIIHHSEVSTPTNTQPDNSAKRKRKDVSVANAISVGILNSTEPRKANSKTITVKKSCFDNEPEGENHVNLPFLNWLASITERINQTMHFQFDGKPDPLVFHVPEVFFECLGERMTCGAKKKRLPNSMTPFTRKDGAPLGTFFKYTWEITNILHVKSIFETPLMPLEITRSFIQNADGTYQLYKREETEIDQYKKTAKSALIQPMELKTFLKVGKTSPDQVEPTPFLIEWIPDILPISKVGELRLKFEFGHARNEPQLRVSKKIPILKKC